MVDLFWIYIIYLDATFCLSLSLPALPVANFAIILIVLYPEKGVCADPVDKGAILGEGGWNPIAVTKSVS